MKSQDNAAELVSAVITTHHRPAGMVKRALDSVMSQEYPSMEVVVVDDSGPDFPGRDDVRAMVLSMDQRPFPVRYVRHEQCRGLPEARNTGLEYCGGKYVAFLDDDDEWSPGKTRAQAAVFASSGGAAGLVYGPYRQMDDDTGEMLEITPAFRGGKVFRQLLRGNWIGFPSFVMFLKSALVSSGGFDREAPFMEDLDAYLRVARDYEVAYCTVCLGTYHDHSGGKMTDDLDRYIRGLRFIDHKYRREIAGDREIAGKRARELEEALREKRLAQQGRQRILLVHTPEISLFPPVLSLLRNLLANGHPVTLITKDRDRMLPRAVFPGEVLRGTAGRETLPGRKNLRILRIRQGEEGKRGAAPGRHRAFQKALRSLVRRQMEENDILWTTTDTTVRELGDEVLRHRHVMQLLELVEDIPLFPGQKLLNCHLDRYARAAWKVVTPQYERSCIQKVWWNLDTLPAVLPNKPYALPDPGHIPEGLLPLIRQMQEEERTILLYQGVFETDRCLDAAAGALAAHQDRICLWMMGRENDLQQELCRRYPFIRFIPFIAPPQHLYITAQADIGLLPYQSTAEFHYSPLNALFCAPNKIYEYAAYGIPMIGSDMPGLRRPFEQYGMGRVCDMTEEGILNAVRAIMADYDRYAENGRRFFRDTNLDSIVEEEILEGGQR